MADHVAALDGLPLQLPKLFSDFACTPLAYPRFVVKLYVDGALERLRQV